MIFFLLAALVAEIIGTFTGFGTSTILVPASSFFIPLKEAIVLVGLFHMFGTFWRTLFFARGIDWKITLTFGIPALVFAGVGASLLAAVEVTILAKLLGILLIIYATYSLTQHKITLPAHPLLLAGGGTLVGFLAGLVGTAGAIRGAFLSSWNIKKDIYLGTGAAMGLGADIARVAVYQQTGLLQFDAALTVALAVTALVATFLGYRIVKVTKQETFAKIIFVALILAGIRFLFI